NFPGLQEGDFSNIFSLLHEMGHSAAKVTHSGVVQERLAKRIHTILYTLATIKSLLQKKITQLWEEFDHTNKQLVHLTRKFEPIEEIFANFYALVFLPAEGRKQLGRDINEGLDKKKWDKAFKAIVEATTN